MNRDPSPEARAEMVMLPEVDNQPPMWVARNDYRRAIAAEIRAAVACERERHRAAAPLHAAAVALADSVECHYPVKAAAARIAAGGGSVCISCCAVAENYRAARAAQQQRESNMKDEPTGGALEASSSESSAHAVRNAGASHTPDRIAGVAASAAPGSPSASSPSPPASGPSPEALTPEQRAAQCWCAPETSGLETNSALWGVVVDAIRAAEQAAVARERGEWDSVLAENGELRRKLTYERQLLRHAERELDEYRQRAERAEIAQVEAAKTGTDELTRLRAEAGKGGAWTDVLAEVERATRKFPSWPTDPLHALAVLGEEFGELGKAVLQTTYECHKSNRDDVRVEAIQTAAMALRFVLSLDVYIYSRCHQHLQKAALPTLPAPSGKASAEDVIREALAGITPTIDPDGWAEDAKAIAAALRAAGLLDRAYPNPTPSPRGEHTEERA